MSLLMSESYTTRCEVPLLDESAEQLRFRYLSMLVKRSRQQTGFESLRMTRKRPDEEDTPRHKKRRIDRHLVRHQMSLHEIDASWTTYASDHVHARGSILLQALRYLASPEVFLELTSVRASGERAHSSDSGAANITQTLTQLYIMGSEVQRHTALQMRLCAVYLHRRHVELTAFIKSQKPSWNDRRKMLRRQRDGRENRSAKPQPNVAAKTQALREMVEESLCQLQLSDTQRQDYEKLFIGLLQQGAPIDKLLQALGVPTMSPALIPLSPHGEIKSSS